MDRRLHNLRPYCMGFGLFWSVPLAMLLGIPTINAPSSDWLTFVWVQQLAVALALPASAALLHRRDGRMPPGAPWCAGALLAAAGFLYTWGFALGNSSRALSVATGLALGAANALFLVLWNTVYANEGQARTAIYLPCSSALAVGACLALLACPAMAASLCLAVAFPFAAAYTLWRSAEDMDPFPIRPLRGHGACVRSDLWKPVLCASVICFAQSLASHVPALYDGGLVVAMLAGFGGACVVVALVGLNPRGIGVYGVYQTLFPLVGVVLFAPALFGEGWLPLMVGTLSFGARLMTLLALMLSATYAARTQFSPPTVFLACAYPLHAASFLGDTAGFLAVGLLSDIEASTLRISAACFIVCLAVLVAASIGKKPHSLAEPVDDTLLINPADGEVPAGVPAGAANARAAHKSAANEPFDGDAPRPTRTRTPEPAERREANGDGGPMPDPNLSAREAEVVELLLKGNTIAAISRKLFISENTTRGHMKRIYRKLDVHSRQELIDLLEGSDAEAEDVPCRS